MYEKYFEWWASKLDVDDEHGLGTKGILEFQNSLWTNHVQNEFHGLVRKIWMIQLNRILDPLECVLVNNSIQLYREKH